MPVVSQRYEPSERLEKLADHPANPRRGVDKSVAESIDRNGWYGAIVAQASTGHILAGHTRRRALAAEGRDRAPVIWVDCDDDTALRILLADNRTAELARWDDEALSTLLGDLDSLDGTGFEPADVDDLRRHMLDSEPTPEEKYTRAADAPHYEPSGTQPPIADLYDESRTRELLASIEAADVPAPLKHFLSIAAQRHTAFRYDRIADYYADAEPAVQRLMEESALVIMDIDDAIRLGYVKLSADLAATWARDDEDDEDDAA